MVTDSIRPSTPDGIKQLAKKIRRERSITHTEALDEASRQAGYENFVHAKRQLAGRFGKNGFPVYLSVHWRRPRVRNGEPRPTGVQAGREILSVDLALPLPDIVAKHRVARGRGLHGFRMEYEDHLEYRTNMDDQGNARDVLLQAVRSLRFMEATGLQPVSTNKYYDLARTLANLPGHDHPSEWFDPKSGGYVYLDEPYTPAIKGRDKLREAWLEQHGLQMVKPEWEGIYYPDECSPHLIGTDGGLLRRVAAALAKVKPVPMPEPWPYPTGVCNEDFVSPKREADAKPRRPRPGPSWREHKGATPYGGAAGIPSRWRPTKPMPLGLHRELGQLLHKLRAGFPWRVTQKLQHVRSELENWAYMEHQREHGDEVDNLYFRSSDNAFYRTHAERLEALGKARSIVANGYEDCKPRRELLAIFDLASGEIKKAGKRAAV